MIERLVCRIRGHVWEYHPLRYRAKSPYRCRRCGLDLAEVDPMAPRYDQPGVITVCGEPIPTENGGHIPCAQRLPCPIHPSSRREEVAG